VLAVRPEEFDQLEDAIDNQAEPQVHERSGVHVERAVARARGQIRHEAEIEQVAYQDNGQVFEPVLCIEKFIQENSNECAGPSRAGIVAHVFHGAPGTPGGLVAASRRKRSAGEGG